MDLNERWESFSSEIQERLGGKAEYESMMLAEQIQGIFGEALKNWLAEQEQRTKDRLWRKFMQTHPADWKEIMLIQMDWHTEEHALARLMDKMKEGKRILNRKEEEEKYE